ncbi:hypothetical protein HPB47_013458 [Ixodes persulcatus]|uniref:Uncharacterized protein n=1 Tax=Ixodes persulcatus TaxID=34615 RepID=A0AC60QZA4_IXOPE|nr:hypothetical protein HPB47_013458 [Ixodes persulcatus]
MMAGSEIFTSEVDTENCVENIDVLRVALSSDGDAYQWLESYRQATDTSWIVDWELPNPTRVVFHKKWRCQHSNLNKTVGLHSTDCPAFVDIKIKKITKDTKKRDPFLKRALPLPAVIRLREEHNHVLNCADGLRFLRSTPDTRACFYNYFKDGLTPAEAIALHAQKLAAQDHTAELLASGAVNPCGNTVYHWFRVWRKNAFGGDAVDPLMKLAEKESTYLKQGVDVKTTKSEDGTCWAVLVVTPIMRRTQGLDTARQIVFLDSTASCDESQSTVTVVLTATPAGAIPLAVLLHSSQNTESYTAAFRLLKQNYPSCFGGAHAPQTFMSDNSAAEKAALQATWPEANQLLCHFHVAQAEWRWLQAARNNVSRDERRELMIAFQKIMYATSSDELDCAIEELRQMPHRGYVARVEAFLERKTEWVLLYRLAITTRGHNTNNFAEATIRILKDVVLCRRKAYNAVALVDLVASVWESYFERRLLTHANNRVSSHQLLYDKLLQRMPEGAAQAVQALGNNVYQVPSGREDDKVYQVLQDIGACTCRAGQQGAFCKHQALIHNIYGGAFPNAPPLTAQDRHQLGLLALGDKCPEASFFRDFADTLKEQPSSSTGGDKVAPPQLLPQLDQQMETIEQPPDRGLNFQRPTSPGSHTWIPVPSRRNWLVWVTARRDQADAADILRQIQEEQWRHHSLAADNPFYSTILEQVLSEMKKVNKEPQVIASYLATKAAYSSARRRGRRIKVQPTGIARRRPGISRGAGRVPAGRPSKGPGTKKTKRAHALHLSVKSGVPHVKSHGTGH